MTPVVTPVLTRPLTSLLEATHLQLRGLIRLRCEFRIFDQCCPPTKLQHCALIPIVAGALAAVAAGAATAAVEAVEAAAVAVAAAPVLVAVG